MRLIEILIVHPFVIGIFSIMFVIASCRVVFKVQKFEASKKKIK